MRAVLSPRKAEGQLGKGRGAGSAAARAALCVLLCVVCLNCMPELARALEGVPVLGQAVRIADLRTYGFRWGTPRSRGSCPCWRTPPRTRLETGRRR